MTSATSSRRAILRDDAGPPFAAWRAARSAPPAAVIGEIERAGLRGRGGAGFPTARKLSLTREAPGERRFVVVNGAKASRAAARIASCSRSTPISWWKAR